MPLDKARYRWWYDHFVSHIYDGLLKVLFLPFGGEKGVRERLLEPVSFGSADRVLDLCCGTGSVALAVASRAGNDIEVFGLDLSPGQIRRAVAKGRSSNARFMVGDATGTGLRDGQFDKVVIPHALHEMFHRDRLAALAEARRLLKPAGELVILELDEPDSLPMRLFVGFWFFYWVPFNFETPTRKDMFRHGLVNEIQEAGFQLLDQESAAGGALQTIVASKRPDSLP